jgi:UDP-N-acetylmuramyl pentapeptide phosphotransferase/UDP-N-acetylglucosamine-1-phosphate transferase
MRYLAGIFALLTAAFGWYYLFYSQAAQNLSDLEDQRLNNKRVALRRVGGVALFLLGAFFFAGFWALDDPDPSPRVFIGVWVTVLALLVLLIVLAMIDVRLTYRLRSRRKGVRQ